MSVANSRSAHTKMKKIKLDERIENAMDAFFETPPSLGRFAMTYTGETAIAANDRTFSEKADKWSGILREIFLFGPGTFLLFYTTLAVAFFYPLMGLSVQGLIMIMAPAFLTYAGAGSITKLKNLAVPATVIAMALAVVFISSLFPGEEKEDLYFWYSIYLFPNVLIAAKLVQGWVSDE